MNDQLKILAVDPANLCGYAHSAGHHGTWDIGRSVSRLAVFRDLLHKARRDWGIDLIAYEDASFGGKNQATKAAHNELRGMIKLVASEIGAKTLSYMPSTIKKFATGNGGADKSQMMRACKTILGIMPRDDNEADALWILEAARQGYLPPKKAAKQFAKRFKPAKQSRFKFR